MIDTTMKLQSVNVHFVDTMKAKRHGATSWLEIKTAQGQEVGIFMDYDMASEIADLWTYMNREPEPQTYDEALAMKCDAEARMDEARKLKGMA